MSGRVFLLRDEGMDQYRKQYPTSVRPITYGTGHLNNPKMSAFRSHPSLAIIVCSLFAISMIPGCAMSWLYSDRSRYMEEVTAASAASDGDIHVLARYEDGRQYHIVIPLSTFRASLPFLPEIPCRILKQDNATLPPSDRVVLLKPWDVPEDELPSLAGNQTLVVMWRRGEIRLYDPLSTPPNILARPEKLPAPWTYTVFQVVGTPFAIVFDVVTFPVVFPIVLIVGVG